MENEVILLQRWKDFCVYYEMATSHIDLMNTDELELSRFVWVEGFEDEATLEEDVTKHFNDEDTEEAGRQNCLGKGLINIGRVACTLSGRDWVQRGRHGEENGGHSRHSVHLGEERFYQDSDEYQEQEACP